LFGKVIIAVARNWFIPSQQQAAAAWAIWLHLNYGHTVMYLPWQLGKKLIPCKKCAFVTALFRRVSRYDFSIYNLSCLEPAFNCFPTY